MSERQEALEDQLHEWFTDAYERDFREFSTDVEAILNTIKAEAEQDRIQKEAYDAGHFAALSEQLKRTGPKGRAERARQGGQG